MCGFQQTFFNATARQFWFIFLPFAEEFPDCSGGAFVYECESPDDNYYFKLADKFGEPDEPASDLGIQVCHSAGTMFSLQCISVQWMHAGGCQTCTPPCYHRHTKQDESQSDIQTMRCKVIQSSHATHRFFLDGNAQSFYFMTFSCVVEPQELGSLSCRSAESESAEYSADSRRAVLAASTGWHPTGSTHNVSSSANSFLRALGRGEKGGPQHTLF